MAYKVKGPIGGEPGEPAQLSRRGAESVRTYGQVDLLGVRVEDISKSHERISLMCLNVTRSQSEGKKGNLCQGIAISHLSTWTPGGVFKAFLWGW